MHVLLIINPRASSMTRRRAREIERSLSQHHEVEVAHTEARGHAVELARDAAGTGAEAVVVAAGDGTLNEAATGIMGTRAALAALPGGSTNVFARSIGVSNRIGTATAQLTASLAERSIKRIGVGTANGRPFLFHLGVGFDARVISRVERHQRLKRWVAHPMFAVTAVTTFIRGIDRRRALFRVIHDHRNDDVIGDGSYAIVSNQTPYTYFGPRPLIVTRNAGLDRALSLTLFLQLRVGALGPAALSAMAGGHRLDDQSRSVVQLADLETLQFVAHDEPFEWQVDGDYLGETDGLEVRYEPDALALVFPVNPNRRARALRAPALEHRSGSRQPPSTQSRRSRSRR